jgi:hypothetical protein
MGAHIYCIVPGGWQPAGDLAGIAETRVAAAHSTRLGIWFSEHAAPPAADAAAIRAHHTVIQAAMTPELTPVPVRFGQWFAAAGDALAEVGAEEAKWLEHLACFAGCVEFGVLIDNDADADTARDVHPPRGSGTAYMAALARRHAAAQRRRAEGEAIALRVHGALTGIVVATRVDFAVAAGLVSLAHLVAREREGQYHAVVDEIRRARHDLRFRFSGPWPPYSFVA